MMWTSGRKLVSSSVDWVPGFDLQYSFILEFYLQRNENLRVCRLEGRQRLVASEADRVDHITVEENTCCSQQLKAFFP